MSTSVSPLRGTWCARTMRRIRERLPTIKLMAIANYHCLSSCSVHHNFLVSICATLLSYDVFSIPLQLQWEEPCPPSHSYQASSHSCSPTPTHAVRCSSTTPFSHSPVPASTHQPYRPTSYRYASTASRIQIGQEPLIQSAATTLTSRSANESKRISKHPTTFTPGKPFPSATTDHRAAGRYLRVPAVVRPPSLFLPLNFGM